MTIALATPALSRAVIPELPSPVETPMRSPLFPSSEISTTPGFMTPSASGARTPTAASRAEGDYFSLPPTTTVDSVAAPVATPSGTLMGRFKFLGKSKKTSEIEQPTKLASIPQDESPGEVKIVCPSRSLFF